MKRQLPVTNRHKDHFVGYLASFMVRRMLRDDPDPVAVFLTWASNMYRNGLYHLSKHLVSGYSWLIHFCRFWQFPVASQSLAPALTSRQMAKRANSVTNPAHSTASAGICNKRQK